MSAHEPCGVCCCSDSRLTPPFRSCAHCGNQELTPLSQVRTAPDGKLYCIVCWGCWDATRAAEVAASMAGLVDLFSTFIYQPIVMRTVPYPEYEAT